MVTFGQKLKYEREDRGLSIAEVAEKTAIYIGHLQALEEDHFDALPHDDVVKGYLRAYAERFDVDAELMIEDYVRQRENGVAGNVARETPGYRFPRLLAVSGAIIVLVALGTWWFGMRETAEPRQSFHAMAQPDATEEELPTPPAVTPVVGERRETAAPAEVEPATTPEPVPAAAAVPDQVDEPIRLSIPEHGVGSGVEDRQLVGESDRFAERTQVWFWNRVQGGTPGERIEHVWLHEGTEANRVTLTLGGSHWRTHSNKMLWPGSAGDWVVEARDESGHVLARYDFVCVP